MLFFYTGFLVLVSTLVQLTAGPYLVGLMPLVAAQNRIRTVSSITSIQSVSQSQLTRNSSILSPLYLGLNFDTDTTGIIAQKVKEMLLIGYNSLWVSVDLDTLELWREKNNKRLDSGFMNLFHKNTIGFKDFLGQINDFLRDTDYGIIQNVVHININLPNRPDNRTWSSTDLNQRIAALTALIRARIDDYFLYEHNNTQSSSDTQQFNNSYNLPSVDDFLSVLHNRVFFTLTSSMSNVSTNVTQLANGALLIPNVARFVDVPFQPQEDYDNNNFFLDSTIHGCPVNRSTSLSGVPVSIVDSASILALRNCGYLPLIGLDIISTTNANSKEEQDILFNQLVSLSNFNIWSWNGVHQPQSSYRCAVLDRGGWRSEDCSNEHHVLCVSSQNASDFFVSANRANYTMSNSRCTELGGSSAEYNFTLPRAITQNVAIHSKIQELNNDLYPVWIDFNSLNVKDCWVTGGPNSLCPYTSTTSTRNSFVKTKWNRNKVALLTISCIITFVLISIIVFLRLDHLPIRNNESKWKKLMLKYKDSQYKGVPS